MKSFKEILQESSNVLVARYANKNGKNVLYYEIWKKLPSGSFYSTISNQHGVNISPSAIDLKSSHADARKNVDKTLRYYDQDGDTGALKHLNHLLPGWKKSKLEESFDLNEGHNEYVPDDMTIKELKIAINSAKNILDMIEDGALIQRWQISAIVKASEELASVHTSMSADEDENEEDEFAYVGFEYPSMYEEADLEENIDTTIHDIDRTELKAAINIGKKKGEIPSVTAVKHIRTKYDLPFTHAHNIWKNISRELDEAPLLGPQGKIHRAASANQSDNEYMHQKFFKDEWKQKNPGKKWPGYEKSGYRHPDYVSYRTEEVELDESIEGNDYSSKRTNEKKSTNAHPNGKHIHHILHKGEVVGTIEPYSASKEKRKPGSRIVQSRTPVTHYQIHFHAGKGPTKSADIPLYHKLYHKNVESALRSAASVHSSWINKNEEVELDEAFKIGDKVTYQKNKRERGNAVISSASVAKKNHFYIKTEKEGTIMVPAGELELAEELDFKVRVDGLPDMYVKGDSPSQVKMNLRKIVKKPDMIQSVDRITRAALKKILRDKVADKEDLDEESES